MKSPRKNCPGLNYGAFWLSLGFGLLFSPSAVTLCHAGGAVVAWGANDAQQSQVPPGVNNVVAVAGGESHSLALQGDGTVAAWGFNLSGQASVPLNLNGVTAIAAGATYSLALRSNGTVVVWGNQTPAPAQLTNVAAIAAGSAHTLALKTDGTVVSWGSVTTVPVGLSNVTAIAAGNGNSLALLRNGTVIAWGDDTYGKSEVPASATNVMAIAAGADHCLALLSNRTVLAWGRNDYGQASVPGGLANVISVSGGALHSLALRNDGTVIAWGDDTYGQTTISGSSVGFIAIDAGGYHNLAIKNDGTPFILAQPVDQISSISSRASFTVFAIGSQPLSYQWQHEGTNIAGAIGATLTLFNLKLTDSGTYTVRVSNSRGAVNSLPVELTVVGGPPLVSIPPQNQTVVCGDNVVFQVIAGGSTNLSYQWSYQGVDIADATRNFLVVQDVSPEDSGIYSVTMTNDFGSTSTGAVLTVSLDAPHIVSPLATYGNQGAPFNYQIQAMHNPIAYAVDFLPDGLTLNTTNGLISGIPTDIGPYFPVITAISPCASESQVLLLMIAPGVPLIVNPALVTGSEGIPLNTYAVVTIGLADSYGGDNLPSGIVIDAGSGLISGVPTFAGEFDSTLWASNQWGIGTANLHFSITNRIVRNMFMDNVTADYSSPFLLDFQFSLYSLSDTNDPSTSEGVVIDPILLSALAMENGQAVGSESRPFISAGSSKLVKVELVLDYTASIASLANGDANGDGVSDAIENMVAGAIGFVDQQASDAQIGVYEFHRDDQAPNRVVGLTQNKDLLETSIAGIWTNYVQGFPAGSRCWDAVSAAISDLGASNRDEQHYVIVISDGQDDSSTNTLDDIIGQAVTNNVRIYSLGFGFELGTNNLRQLSLATQGKYHSATNSAQVATQLAQITKDAKSQYILRWATLKRPPNPTSFTPSFAIFYAGLSVTSPPPVTYLDTNNPIIDTNQMPPTTNYNTITNSAFGDFDTVSNAGPVAVGALRVVPEAQVSPTGMSLRSAYSPRYVRQIRIHYRPNWPCTTTLQSDGPNEILSGWSMSDTSDGAGGRWLLLSSPNPSDLETSIPFAAFGRLVRFQFQDIINPSNAFSVFDVDNTIYTNTGGQSFAVENGNSFINVYPALPHGTPVEWLINHGYSLSSTWVTAETADPDNDGVPNWKEYRANTDPRNPRSKFVIRSLSRGPDGRFEVTFSASTNRVYRVDASSDLILWQTVQDNIQGINQDITVSDKRLIGNLDTVYYRVLVY
ncbi:MAG TPA: immunoglobulin domain-containing protein [Candidatus Limnocylindrales bacterium]|nr:immunoglobulin domain-containing protein [Candidatus Limnocylindrales bacterium]